MIATKLNFRIDLFQLISESHSTDFDLQPAKASDNLMQYGADVQNRIGVTCAMSDQCPL